MLRKAVSILLILAMSIQCLYRLGLVTWFEMNREYVATVLCINKAKPEMHCNGQCYLKKEIQKSESKQTVPVNSRDNSEFQFFVVEDFSIDFEAHTSLVRRHTPYLVNSTRHSVNDKFRPPSQA